MKALKYIACATFLFMTGASYASTVTPIIGNYGNVFPTLTEQNITSVASGSSPWYVTFDLLTTANVSLGTEGYSTYTGLTYPPLNVTAIRLVTLDGTNVQFGTDTFSKNPFPDPITQLVVANNLSAGQYALEINGVSTSSTPNVITRIQVLALTSVPVPAAAWLFVSALAGLGLIGKSAVGLEKLDISIRSV